MGLASYREYKLRKQLLDFLNEFGIKEEDLKYLPKALEIVKNSEYSKPVQAVQPTQKEKQDFENKARTTLTAQDIINQFAGDTEEFYPYGKPKEK